MHITIIDVRLKLRHIAESLVTPKDQEDAYINLLKDILSHTIGSGMVEILKLIVETCIHEDFSKSIARNIFSYLISEVFPGLCDNESKILGHFILEKVHLRTSYFEDQIVNIRRKLSSIYEKEKNWEKAILMLDKNLSETEKKISTDDLRLETCIKIAQLYLEGDNSLLAETYIRRASFFQIQTNNENLQVLYKVIFARVLDYRQKFIEAAQKYIELLSRPNITESERMKTLNSALVCTIISPVGEPRSRMLSTLYKDEKCQTLIRFSILEKMYLCRLIKPNEINELETMLLPHQKVNLKDGTSILTEAMLEHNMLSISKLYANIKIESLGSLLNIKPYKAEKKAGKMISEGHIEGSINQIDGFIYFKSQSGDDLIQTWDKKIESVCCQVDRIIETMSADPSIRAWMNNYIDNQMS